MQEWDEQFSEKDAEENMGEAEVKSSMIKSHESV